jgi:cytidylate kinase
VSSKLSQDKIKEVTDFTQFEKSDRILLKTKDTIHKDENWNTTVKLPVGWGNDTDGGQAALGNIHVVERIDPDGKPMISINGILRSVFLSHIEGLLLEDETDIPDIPTDSKPEPIVELKPVYTKLSIKEEIIAMMPEPILLEGPVGSGKSTLLMDIAKELGLKYFASVMSDATTASEFKGYKNVVDGKYVTTEFREAYENGGIYVLEELNATSSNMPIIFNSIENGYFVFADKLVYGHKDFRLCATMNTITSAKDFGGRRPLDKSVRSRFHTIIVKTDFNSRFSKDLVWLQKEISNALDAKGHTNETDPRDLTRYMKLLKIGMDPIKAVQGSLDKEKILSSSFIGELIKKAKDKK